MRDPARAPTPLEAPNATPGTGDTFVPEPGCAIPPPSEIGGKAWNLARLAGEASRSEPAFAVPAFFVIPASAFQRLAPHPTTAPRTAEEIARRQEEMQAMELPDELRAAVLGALEATGLASDTLAVRSSAAEEDAAGASFAGQFDSVLGVRAGEGQGLWDALRRVWASAYNLHAAAYREGRAPARDRCGPPRMAVIVQRLVEPFAAGVAFSIDPVSGRRDIAVVSAVYGLGEGLVNGTLDADTYRVTFAGDRATDVRAEIARKERAVRRAPAGLTRLEPVPEERWLEPALADDEARRVAGCARRLAERLGGPQDVEWALAEEPEAGEGPGVRGTGRRRLYILQTRPITTLAPPSPGAAESDPLSLRVWDNSNIIESYSGVTTPLTFSFARSVYEDVYRQFCRVMGVGDGLLEAHRPVFANMLGLVRGRVYYNLINWYRTLALLPGFTFNRSFMERMMGVRERLEDPPEPPRAASRWGDLVRLVRMMGRMAGEARRLEAQVPAFRARVERTLAPLRGQDLAAWPALRVIALYRDLERELLQHWRPPLVNDFFAMVSFGVLGRLIERWLPGSPPTLANDLLCGEGGMISTEPARQVLALARQVRETPALAGLFSTEPDDRALWRRIVSEPEFADLKRGLDSYLERFGDRCMEELKLETVTLAEDPAFLIATLRAHAAHRPNDAAPAGEARIQAEATVRARLRGPLLALFLWVLERTRRRVRDRENLRFERTRVFAVVRRMFLALGGHLAAAGRIGTVRDVFYLTREEIFAHFDGAGVTADLAALVRLRRAEFEAYARGPAPPDRFETRGAPADWRLEAEGRGEPAAEARSVGDELRGTGCCPGVVRARVRVVRDPRAALGLAGRILVAERTDPGWTLLFPAARGLLVQRGSLLSHSAIVAREMGIPCVVGIPRLLETLADGELVQMDGATGIVLRLEAPTPAEEPGR